MGRENDRSRAKEMVDALPDDALPELMEALETMKEFYKERADYAPQPKPEPVTYTAKVGKTYTRPEFFITED